MTGSWWKRIILCVAVFPLPFTAVSGMKGTWVSNYSQPGPNEPPVGRSLFDYLFTKTGKDGAGYVIPFPFSQLVKQIQEQLAETSTSGAGIRQVLIPMGRSLVRNASQPDFFSHPRLVLAVDAQPRFDANHAGLLLKDRLYIGYMEGSRLLEVISYNEAAGRFEFQLVEDYGPDTQPKVSYANRKLCLACHQNAAPIFSRQQWDETNANPEVDVLLEQQGAPRYGIPTGAGVDIPFAIDAATDRANYYTYYQLMWRQGCQQVPAEADNAEQDAIRCRAALLRAALQYLLTDGSGFDTGVDALQVNAARHWPEGLLIPDPDIPNRNPLLTRGGSANVIGEAFDPLVLRPALKWLDAGSDPALQLLVRGLAEFLARPDGERLDQHLFNTAMEQRLMQKYELSCSLQEKIWKGEGRRFGFDCQDASIAAPGPVTSLEGRFTLEQNEVSHARVSRLSLSDGAELRNLAMHHVDYGAEKGVVRFRPHNGKLHARFPNGNSLGDFVLEWQASDAGPTTATAHLSVLTDFGLVDDALGRLAQQAMAKRIDSLSDRPFRRASVIPALFANLGLDQLEWCCIGTIAMPVATTKEMNYQEMVELKPFYQYCNACHASASVFPANFLYGDEAQVKRQVSHCAERIYYRLSMARKNTGNRSKSPMPPLLMLETMGQDESLWADSGSLEAMKNHVTGLLQGQGKTPDLEQYERLGFDQLQNCLPAIE